MLEVGSDPRRDVALYISWRDHVLRDHVWRFLRRAAVRGLACVCKAWRHLAPAAAANSGWDGRSSGWRSRP